MPKPPDRILSMTAPPQDKGYSCPKCNHRMNVVNTRQDWQGSVRRRRECPQCSHRLSTVEVVVTGWRDEPESERRRWELIKGLAPRLFAIADEIDLLRAEHD